jgi:hypothetical protein
MQDTSISATSMPRTISNPITLKPFHFGMLEGSALFGRRPHPLQGTSTLLVLNDMVGMLRPFGNLSSQSVLSGGFPDTVSDDLRKQP